MLHRASLIFVAGPTTVGKTTVRHYIEKTITTELLPTLPDGHFPLLSIEIPAIAPGQRLDWRDIYARLLIGLGDPLVDKKLNYPVGGIRRGPDGSMIVHTGTTTSALRMALEKSLDIRKPRVIVLDEAHHLAMVKNGDDLLKQLELLKSLANTTKIPILLFGTYDIQPLLRLNGQLSRRSEVIHMPRYHCDNSVDDAHFSAAVVKLQKCLPLLHAPDLLPYHDLLYRKSLGCIGLLKAWLCRALWRSLMAQSETIDRETLESEATPTWKCSDIIRECNVGEHKLRPNPAEELALDEALMAMPVPKILVTSKKSARTKTPPFQRKAARDPIGNQNDAVPQEAA